MATLNVAMKIAGGGTAHAAYNTGLNTLVQAALTPTLAGNQYALCSFTIMWNAAANLAFGFFLDNNTSIPVFGITGNATIFSTTENPQGYVYTSVPSWGLGSVGNAAFAVTSKAQFILPPGRVLYYRSYSANNQAVRFTANYVILQNTQ